MGLGKMYSTVSLLSNGANISYELDFCNCGYKLQRSLIKPVRDCVSLFA